MVNYRNAKIYAIRTHESDEVYIGSTTEKLCVRMAKHRRHYKCYKNGKHHYITSFILLEHDDAYIELLENCPCNNKEELLKNEGRWIRKTPQCVNTRVEGRTKQEYRQENKEHCQKYDKEYYEKNKDRIKSVKKQYRDKNKTQLLDKKKKYYEANKQKIKEYQQQKFECPCSGKYTQSHKSIHEKTKKHQKYLEQQNA